MADTLISKRLDDGNYLRIVQYKVGPGSLRPEGSLERVLEITKKENDERTPDISTDPQASWFLSTEQYHNMFDSISSIRDFNILDAILRQMSESIRDLNFLISIKRSSETDENAELILEQLADKYK